jgi:hypothetical protein
MASSMELTNKFIPIIVSSIHHFKSMKSDMLLPEYLVDLIIQINVDFSNIKKLITRLNLNKDNNVIDEIKIDSNEANIIIISLINFLYSIETNQDLTQVFNFFESKKISKPNRKEVINIFNKLCFGLKFSPSQRRLYIDCYERNRSLQLEDLIPPKRIQNTITATPFS